MQVIALPYQTRAETGFTHKFIVSFQDLLDAASVTGAEVELVTARTGDLVTQAAFRLVTPFVCSDVAIDSLTMEVGNTGSTARFIDAQQVATVGTEVLFYAGGALSPATLPFAFSTGQRRILATFTVSGGLDPLMSTVTSGQIEIYLAMTGNLVALGTVY